MRSRNASMRSSTRISATCADIQGDPGESRDLGHLPLCEEPLGDAALIEDLDGARVQAASARSGERLAGSPLDDGNVDVRQRQLARQHQPRGTASGDHHLMFSHSHRCDPIVTRPSSIPPAGSNFLSKWAF
jgi:hypothetical protein